MFENFLKFGFLVDYVYLFKFFDLLDYYCLLYIIELFMYLIIVNEIKNIFFLMLLNKVYDYDGYFVELYCVLWYVIYNDFIIVF